MILLKLFIVYAALFETLNAVEVKENVSFSVEKLWQSYRKKDNSCTCSCDDEDKWKEGVQQYYDGVRKATWEFRGASNNIADTAVKLFEILLTKLIYFAETDSTVLRPSSTAILESVSKGNKLQNSSLTIIKEFDKVILEQVNDSTAVITKLSDIIQLTTSVNDALNDLGSTFSTFMKEFIKSGTTGFKKRVDYEPVFKKFQKLLNTVALIAETLLNRCKLGTNDVKEAVTVVSLILAYFGITVQGINSCVLDTLYGAKCDVSQRFMSISTSFQYVVVEVTQAVGVVVFPLTDDSITALLTNYVNTTVAFNQAVKDSLGLFEGVPITVGQITQHSSQSVSSSVT